MSLPNRALRAIMLLCGLILSACAHERINRIKPFPPGSHSAIQPVARMDYDWWAPRQEQVLERVRQGNVGMILIGDSITHGWDGETELWTKCFARRNAVNMGFGGDRTEHVLWRLHNGSLEGISPKVAMIMIGTNNSNGDDNTAAEIADGIVAICREIRLRSPETKILLLAIFPRGEGPSAQREKNARASLLASQVADNKHIFYLNINDRFLGPDQTLAKDIMPDLLHPNHQGYVIWAEAVDPVIARLMGEDGAK